MNIKYEVTEDSDGYPSTLINVDYEKEGKIHTKGLKQYLEEEVDDSIHEYIRGNVLLATRYFNHRVKAFIKDIAMGGGNLMNVDRSGQGSSTYCKGSQSTSSY